MRHIAIDLGGRESKFCARSADGRPRADLRAQVCPPFLEQRRWYPLAKPRIANSAWAASSRCTLCVLDHPELRSGARHRERHRSRLGSFRWRRCHRAGRKAAVASWASRRTSARRVWRRAHAGHAPFAKAARRRRNRVGLRCRPHKPEPVTARITLLHADWTTARVAHPHAFPPAANARNPVRTAPNFALARPGRYSSPPTRTPQHDPINTDQWKSGSALEQWSLRV